MMKHVLDFIESVLGRALAKYIFSLAAIAWLTWLAASNVVKIRDDLRTQFNALNTRIEQVNAEAWTLKMQIEYARIVSEWNSTNKIPDPYRIWRDVREGKSPTGIRIGP